MCFVGVEKMSSRKKEEISTVLMAMWLRMKPQQQQQQVKDINTTYR
jgi:hypothetical protein